jgi:hypothetical protein
LTRLASEFQLRQFNGYFQVIVIVKEGDYFGLRTGPLRLDLTEIDPKDKKIRATKFNMIYELYSTEIDEPASLRVCLLCIQK